MTQRVFIVKEYTRQAISLSAIRQILYGSRDALQKLPRAVEREERLRRAHTKTPAGDVVRSQMSSQPQEVLATSLYYKQIQAHYALCIQTLLSEPEFIQQYSRMPSFTEDLKFACTDNVSLLVTGSLLKRCVVLLMLASK